MPITSITNALSESAGGMQSFRGLEQGGRVIRPPGESASPLGPDIATREVQPDFMGLVKDFMGGVQEQQSRAKHAAEAFVSGEITDLHQVMVAKQEASIAMDLLIELRNKTVEAFQEIMRINV